jgi:hypothetical protein
MSLLETAEQQNNKHFHCATKKKLAPSTRVYRFYYRRICNNRPKMAEGWRFHLSRKDQMNSDSWLSDPRQRLLGKGKTSGIQLPPKLYATTHDTSVQREPPNIHFMWLD